jgi:hypothetical protein
VSCIRQALNAIKSDMNSSQAQAKLKADEARVLLETP